MLWLPLSLALCWGFFHRSWRNGCEKEGYQSFSDQRVRRRRKRFCPGLLDSPGKTLTAGTTFPPHGTANADEWSRRSRGSLQLFTLKIPCWNRFLAPSRWPLASSRFQDGSGLREALSLPLVGSSWDFHQSHSTQRKEPGESSCCSFCSSIPCCVTPHYLIAGKCSF